MAKIVSCYRCDGKGFIKQSISNGDFYSRCSACNGRGYVSAKETVWDRCNKYLTPEIMGNFFVEICRNASGCEYCPIWRECCKLEAESVPTQEDWVNWFNSPTI